MVRVRPSLILGGRPQASQPNVQQSGKAKKTHKRIFSFVPYAYASSALGSTFNCYPCTHATPVCMCVVYCCLRSIYSLDIHALIMWDYYYSFLWTVIIWNIRRDLVGKWGNSFTQNHSDHLCSFDPMMVRWMRRALSYASEFIAAREGIQQWMHDFGFTP